MNLGKFGALFGILISFNSFAEEADSLSQAQELLRDPKSRNEAIQGNEKAEKVDAYVKKMGLSAESQNGVYDLTADILKTLADQNGGDSTQLAEKMRGYLSDPSSIEKALTTEQKKRIHELSLQTPSGQSTQLDSGIRP